MTDKGVSTLVLFDGSLGLVEPEQREGLDRRIFRHCGKGYEWAHFRDATENGRRARWYGYAGNELPDTMRAF